MPRAKRLSTAEAADRLGVSERQMRALAKSHWIGKKEGGGWTFTETEIRKLDQERKDHQKAVTAPTAKAHGLQTAPPRSHRITTEVFGDLVGEY